MGKNVIVIGGGDVAFDAGRTALRLGAEKVTLVCIEDDETMPASADEIEEGLDESISFICSCMPTAVVAGPDGRAAKVEFTACTLGDADERGWRPPVPLDNTFSEIACDTVVFATGQGMVDDFAKRRHGRQGRKEPDRDRQADPGHRPQGRVRRRRRRRHAAPGRPSRPSPPAAAAPAPSTTSCAARSSCR